MKLLIGIAWLIIALPVAVLLVLVTVVAAFLGTIVEAGTDLVQTRHLRYVGWRLGMTGNNCPYCRKPLKVSGWEPEERYTCPTEGCEFNR